MKRFRLFSIVTVAAVYFLIFFGGLVRVSGAGLGCPDWPKCFGRWIPPTDISQLPPDISPAQFNFTLAWIEYINRAVGVMVGFLILGLAAYAIVRLRKHHTLVFACLGALFLVAYQGWQGSVVVSSELRPLIVTVHLLLALLIASLLLYIWHESYVIEHRSRVVRAPASRLPVIASLLWLGGLIQITVGAFLRGSIDTVRAANPLAPTSELLASTWLPAHMMSGVLLTSGTILFLLVIRKTLVSLLPVTRFAIAGLATLSIVQLGGGVILAFISLSPLSQLFHLWIAALYIGCAVVLQVSILWQTNPDSVLPRTRIPLLPTAATLLLLIAVAISVVARAEQSRIPPVLSPAPSFRLDSIDSTVVTDNLLEGKITVLDFIFTNCKGACPAMAVQMQRLSRAFPKTDLVQFISITVDPDNDTPEVLRAYRDSLAGGDNRWQFLRTTRSATVELAEKGFAVSGDLPGLHSTKFILIDNTKQIRGYYEHSDDADMDLLRVHLEAIARGLVR